MSITDTDHVSISASGSTFSILPLTVNYSAIAPKPSIHAVCGFCNKRCPSSPYGTITQHPKPFPSIPETSMSDPPHPSPSSPSDRTEAYDKKEETGRFPIHQSIHHQTHIRSFVMRTRTHKNNTISLLFFLPSRGKNTIGGDTTNIKHTPSGNKWNHENPYHQKRSTIPINPSNTCIPYYSPNPVR